MAVDIRKAGVREKLGIDPEPHYAKIARGQALGVRIGKTGESWIARYRDADGKHHYRPLGDFATIDAAKRFDVAARAAREWFESCGVGIIASWTVKVACEKYIANLRDTNGKEEKRIRELEGFFHRDVYCDAIAGARVDSLTSHAFEEWRGRISKRRDKPLANSSVNRIVRQLATALSFAFSKGQTKAPTWRAIESLLVHETDGGQFIELEHRQTLLGAATGALHDFVLAMATLGARPIELRRTTRADLDLEKRTLRLWSFKGKRGIKRERYCPIPAEALAMFRRIAADKLPAAPLFMRDDGKAWTKDVSVTFTALAVSVGLGRFQLYDWRHTRIASLLSAGVDVQFVSMITGTSLQMIDKTYKKYIPSDASKIDRVKAA